jgi:tetratricopeptide (TPR) repeat protein
MASAGQLTREDMLLPPGGTKWLPASSVEGLFPQVSVAALTALFPEVALSEPPRLPARTRPASPNACPHCKGTAFCGRSWDADGMMVRGPVCEQCRTRSGLGAALDVDKVTCSHCLGKGFVQAAEQDAAGVRRDAVAWRLQALALSDSGHYEQAVQAYNEAIRLAPDFADAYYERGWAYLALGQNELGELDLAEAARLAPRYAASEQGAAPGAGDAGAANKSAKLLGWIGGLFRR